MNNLKQRIIRVIIGIGEGIRGDVQPSDFWVLDNHRVSVEIQAYGGETQGMAHVKIFGLPISDMNALTSMGPVMYQVRAANSIQILAGEDMNALSTVYFGVIVESSADFNQAPDVALAIMAQSGAVAAMQNAPDYHYNGKISAAEVLEYLAGKLKWQFQNLDIGAGNMGVGGKDEILIDPTYQGSYWSQIQQIARDKDFLAIQEDKSTTSTLKIKHHLSVFPTPEQIVSPKTNMIGYPTFTQSNMTLKALFMPSVSLGTVLTVEDSLIAPANGKWLVHSVVHELESNTPDGKWQTTCGVMPYELFKQS